MYKFYFKINYRLQFPNDYNKVITNYELSTQINGNKNLKAADETVRQASETFKTAAEMIYKMDDTMTQEEENLCQRANQLRRKSEVTFKTIDPTK